MALLAFCTFMWVTIPHAYGDSIRRRIDWIVAEQRNGRLTQLSASDLDKPIDWLDGAMKSFGTSALFWMSLTGLLIVPDFVPAAPSWYVDILAVGGVAMGVILLANGMLRSHQVIMFSVHPESLRGAVRLQDTTLLYARGFGVAAFSMFWFMDLGYAAAFVMGSLFLKPITESNAMVYASGLLFMVGAVSLVPLLWSLRATRIGTRTWKDVIGPVLAVLPVIYFVALAVIGHPSL